MMATDTVNGVTFDLTYTGSLLTLSSDNCDWKVMYDTKLPLKELTLLASSVGDSYTGLCGACPSG